MAETNTTEGYAPFDLYAYNPAQPPAYLFLGLFGGTAVVHFVLMFPYRCAFPIPMIIGCGSEKDLQTPCDLHPIISETDCEVICFPHHSGSRGLLLPIKIPRQCSPNPPIPHPDTHAAGLPSFPRRDRLHVPSADDASPPKRRILADRHTLAVKTLRAR